ncbi:hypothetical protein GOV10_04175 [Candidatus Woesearchaeota archaeon]|nr:hypothetical protein [Candidatus Woesearchaeota archaeon]
MTRKASNENYPASQFHASLRRSFRLGFTTSLFENAKKKVAMDSQEEQNKYELVVVDKIAKRDKWIEDSFKLAPPKKHRSVSVDNAAYVEGRIQGNSVDLSTKKVLK